MNGTVLMHNMTFNQHLTLLSMHTKMLLTLVCLGLFIFLLQTKLTSVSLRGISASSSNNDISGNDFHGNFAFEGIGDDDL